MAPSQHPGSFHPLQLGSKLLPFQPESSAGPRVPQTPCRVAPPATPGGSCSLQLCGHRPPEHLSLQGVLATALVTQNFPDSLLGLPR